RLNISFDGARYHVAEILSKLGVSSRHEAAAWRPETSGPAVVAPVMPFFAGGSGAMTALKVGGAAVLISFGIGLLLLALGVFSMSKRQEVVPLQGPLLLYSTEVFSLNQQSRNWPTR